MVSTRPSPAPAKGRISYPSATAYTPGDQDTSPTYLNSEPVTKSTSRDSQAERAQNLKTWWKGFRESTEPRPVFGVPLRESVQYASVQISTAGDDGQLYVWGVIPIVVAKCGLFLKENGTEVEGTFRISGSTKRMRELQTLFETPPKYGKDVDWASLTYTTHDVATIFRRFLTQMPESVIPMDFYTDFRDALDVEDPIAEYKSLIRRMPPVNQYLLLYVLDLLSVFARKSDINLMTTPNLALIFQPGVLSHPAHDMRPKEHVLSQGVLEFLIEHQDHFLVGMDLQPEKPEKPKLVKADADMMLPSDSDEEAPAGGYYIVETKRGPTSPPPPTSPISVSMLFTPKWPKYVPKPITHDVMAPSDSDEDAPPGGYEVRSMDPDERKMTLLSRPRKEESLGRRKTLPTRRSGNSARKSKSKEV